MTINRAAAGVLLTVLGLILGGFLIGFNAARIHYGKTIDAANESLRVVGWQRENYRARLLECRGIHSDEEPGGP